MKNETLFYKTISILVKAYQNDTLNYTDCAACAVGNLIMANNNYTHKSINTWLDANGNKVTPSWSAIIQFGSGVVRRSSSKYYEDAAIKEIKSTGYEPIEIALIEAAFNFGTNLFNSEDESFDGLMYVVDALMQIHEATADEVTEAKQLFVKI